ncbi:MAG: bifunctional folylpolyglutamate synthase/dihydrofolate synthase [Planctomycetaceae bacterium]|jgi:dihydrofolate synthase/folylpolyglutamate synthase|nr:bifunctional folylpolyglutamate synthase/dihydrofolate synthase [Planctomycetaceae bacterium]
MPSQHLRESEANVFLANLVNLETVVHFDYAALGEKLETLRRILSALGNPEKRFATVHVAGSKGKGSVCAMVDNTLRLAGYRTGCFTSPHIDSVTERITIDGNTITMDTFVDEILQLKTFLQSRGGTKLLSYFDILTLAAIDIFAQQNVDVAILEVGMGGLYDSTNVCNPTVSGITEIELEHTEYLGDTIEKISVQKAGIIRSNVPAVVAQPNINLPPEQLSAILPKNSILIPPSTRTVENLHLTMPGKHQTKNAAVAAAILEQLRGNCGMKKLTTEIIRDGIATTKIPLRIEQLSTNPMLIIDAAHTVKSTKSLLEVLNENKTYEKKTLLLGLMRDKNIEGILEVLLPFFDKTIFTRCSESARALSGKELAGKTNSKQYEIIEAPITAFQTIRQNAKPNDLICVTGSFYLGATIRRLFVDNR